MKLTKRLLSLLLALAMVCAIMPVGLTAAAEETTPITEDLQIPEQAEPADAETDAVGTQIPTITEHGEIAPQVNPLYQGMIDESALNPHVPTAAPDASVQATYVSASSAGTSLRSSMKNRTESVTLYVSDESSNYSVVLGKVLAVAVEHTGNGREGDYLNFHVAGVSGSYERSYSGSTYKYTFELTFTYLATAAQETQVTNAVSNLISTLGVRYKSDYEKITAVYDYMCQNITYDYDHLDDPDYLLQFSAYGALIDKTAVCQGYALLFYRLMLELGVDCRVITGIGGDAENYGPHAWNIVEIDGLYYNVDATWDAGYDEYIWFLNNTWNFVYHYRDMEYETMEFHNTYPMAAEDYVEGEKGEIDPYIYAGLCGDEALYLMGRDGSITIAGSGAMYDYGASSSTMPDWRYMWEDYITSVTVTEGITYIGDCAFAYLENLTSVTLPGGLEEIGDQAFLDCSVLTGVDIPDTVTGIYRYAFHGCSSLTSIELSENLTTLGDYAFAKIPGITELYIPKSVSAVGSGVFSDCTSLVSVTFGADTIPVGAHMFEGCSVLSDVNLPADLTVIPEYAFAKCSALNSITLPEGLTVIGSFAFSECSSLDSISFPEALTEISHNAFRQTALTEVTIPKSIATVGSGVFSDCTSLVSVTFDADTIPMGTHMFKGCSELKDINLPADLTVIPESAFENCSALSTITLPEGLTSIDSGAFSLCTSLSDITLPEGLTKIGTNAFYQCTSLSGIIFPETLTVISNYAFASTGLTEVNFPASVTTIGYSAFSNCEQLTEVYIPETVTSLSGFSSCDNLERAYLYNTGRIGDYAFSGCGKLSYIEFSENITAIGVHSFEDCNSLTELIVPDTITSIDVGAFQGCDNLETVDLNNTRFVGGYAFYNCKSLKTFIIGEDTTHIGGAALQYCSALTELTIPANVTAGRSFMDFLGANTSLTEITFLGDAPWLSAYSFSGITATVYYPEGNDTWTEDIMQDYGGHITWVAVCAHSYEAVVTDPTCTEQGYTTYSCTLCVESYIADYTDPTGHTPGEVRVENEVSATCTEKGSYDNVTLCAVCGEEYLREAIIVDEIPHTPGDVQVENEVAATCSAKGSYDNVTCCTVCGIETSRETVETDMIPHTYSAEVTDPTCEEQGCTTHTCTVCGDSYADSYTDALGHTYSYELTTKPTQTGTGTLTGTCAVCGGTTTVVLPMLNEEDYTCEVTLEPTDDENGAAIYTWNITDYGTVTFEVKLRKLSGLPIGDLNDDGEVDIFDANLVVAYYNGTAVLDEDQLDAADVNGDGEVDIFDANLIVSYYNGTLPAFPVE